tara:strand:- start:13 stop:303 length:291 start_codon:yes stop_codon:yes gene_type:complete
MVRKFNIFNEGFRQQWEKLEERTIMKKKVDWQSYATELANEYIGLHKKVKALIHLLGEEYRWDDKQIEELIVLSKEELQNFDPPVLKLLNKLIKKK